MSPATHPSFFLFFHADFETNYQTLGDDIMKLRVSEVYVIDADDYRREGLHIAVLGYGWHGKSHKFHSM